jgi:hypothetical protein
VLGVGDGLARGVPVKSGETEMKGLRPLLYRLN